MKEKYPTIDRSVVEEFLAVSSFIAGAMVWDAGIHWLGTALFIKGGLDILSSFVVSFREHNQDSK